MADTIVHSEADERQMLEAISKWIKTKVAPVALKLEHENEWPAELVADMTELGLFGALVPAREPRRGQRVAVVNRLQ